MGNTLLDNRHGLIANDLVSTANGHAKHKAATVMAAATCEAADDDTSSITLGADKRMDTAYDAREFVDASRNMGVTPHARRTSQGGAQRCPRQSPPPRASAVAAQAQAHRAGLWLGQDGGRPLPDDDGWAQARGPLVRVDDDGVQLQAHALVGANPRAACVRSAYGFENGANGFGVRPPAHHVKNDHLPLTMNRFAGAYSCSPLTLIVKFRERSAARQCHES